MAQEIHILPQAEEQTEMDECLECGEPLEDDADTPICASCIELLAVWDDPED
jgi:hypothetical protein